MERIKVASFQVFPPFPKNMMVELTNYCNHSCIFCANSEMKRKRGFINYDLLCNIAKQAYDLDIREIGLYTTGESLLYPRLLDLILYLKSTGFTYVYLTTNGVRLTPKLSKKLIDAGLDSIKFSINGGTDTTYKKIHQKDDFATVIDNLITLNQIKDINKSKIKILATYIICEENNSVLDLSRIESIFEAFTDDYMFILAGNQGGNKEGKISNMIPCSMVFNRLHITWEGYLTACCVDFEGNLIMADLNKVPLIQGWYSTKFTKLRVEHLKKNLINTQCKKCTEKKDDTTGNNGNSIQKD
jgi:pyruvate-formate lyase-activating enzyme